MNVNHGTLFDRYKILLYFNISYSLMPSNEILNNGIIERKNIN